MTIMNDLPAEVVKHYNNLQRFLDSGLVRNDVVDFVHMSMAQIERDTGIKS